MAEVVRTTRVTDGAVVTSDDGGAWGIVLVLIVLVVAGVLFFAFGRPSPAPTVNNTTITQPTATHSVPVVSRTVENHTTIQQVPGPTVTAPAPAAPPAAPAAQPAAPQAPATP